MQLIQSKGQERKADMRAAAVFQTTDCAKSHDVNSLPATLNSLNNQEQAYANEVQKTQAEYAAEKQTLVDLKEQLVNKSKQLQAEKASNTSSDSAKSSCRAETMKVTPKMIKNLNKILQNDSPATLVECLENFLSLLRNKANTTNADVELFMKDHNKLVIKMNKLETTGCDLELVE